MNVLECSASVPCPFPHRRRNPQRRIGELRRRMLGEDAEQRNQETSQESVPSDPRRQSLVTDAQQEASKKKGVQDSCLAELKKEGIEEHFHLTEQEVIYLSRFPKDDPNCKLLCSFVLSLPIELSSAVPKILKCFQNYEGRIEHLETRPARNFGQSFDVFIKVSIKRLGLLNAIKCMREYDGFAISLLQDGEFQFKDIWFPKHISDLDRCNHILSKFEPGLDSNHPGFSDVTYRDRRKEIAKIAFDYQQGQPIPRVQYTDEETKTWGVVYNKLHQLNSKHACTPYLTVFRVLEEECGYSAEVIPQLQDVSTFLKRKSGFILRPAAGLVSARDFLASLAFRVFQCTQYVRHGSNPQHSPEPDCVHELLGHVPMLADPSFARFSQEIGLASLGGSDEDIQKLSTIYWFTVEFGLCKEDGKIKAYGAGLLSSYGELMHAMSDKSKFLLFDPTVTAVQPYQDLFYQDVYFVANSFDEAKDKVRSYVSKHMSRPYEVSYDPYTESVREIDSLSALQDYAALLKSDVSSLMNAIQRLMNLEK